jgi:transcriptional regulator with XRE-family HTH domain
VLRGWTQAQCDEAAGVATDSGSSRTFSYERNRAQPPREYIQLLADEWDIDADWFFDGEDNTPPTKGKKSCRTALIEVERRLVLIEDALRDVRAFILSSSNSN